MFCLKELQRKTYLIICLVTIIFLYLSSFTYAQNASAQNGDDVDELEPGAVKEVPIYNNAVSTFKLKILPKQYLYIVVEPESPVHVLIKGPDGSKISEFEVVKDELGGTNLITETNDNGNCLISIQGLDATVKKSKCKIRVSISKAATEQHQKLLESLTILGNTQNLLQQKETTSEQRSQAIRQSEKAVATINNIYDLDKVTSDNPLAAVYLTELAKVCVKLGYQQQARLLSETALKILELPFSKEETDLITDTNTTLANAYFLSGLYSEAKEKYLSVRKIREQRLHEATTDEKLKTRKIVLAEASANLANLYRQLSQFNEAESLFQEAIRYYKEVLGSEHNTLVTPLNNFALMYSERGNIGDLEKALGLYNQIKEIREKTSQEIYLKNIDYAITLHNIGILFQRKGEYGKAEETYREALKRFPDEMYPAVSDIYNSLGLLCKDLGRYAEAEKYYKDCRDIRDKLHSSPPSIATVKQNLATLYEETEDYTKAPELFQEALDILEPISKENPALVSTVLNNLAVLYEKLGKADRAEELYKKALEGRIKIFGPVHPRTAEIKQNLANFYRGQGKYEEAESMLLSAIKVTEDAYGTENRIVATMRHNLALVLAAKAAKTNGSYKGAETEFQTALHTREHKDVLGPNHPLVAATCREIGVVKERQKQYTDAKIYYEKALEIRKNAFGLEHSSIANSLSDLSRVSLLQNDIAQAIKYQRDSNNARESYIAKALLSGSENDKRNFLTIFKRDIDRSVSLNVNVARDDPEAKNLAVTVILERKNRLLDAISNVLGSIRQSSSPSDKALIDNWKKVIEQLAALESKEVFIEKSERDEVIKKLQKERQKLEAEMSHPGLKIEFQQVTIDAVRNAIPANAALIEFLVYQPRLLTPEGVETFGPPEYVAYVLFNKDVQCVPLGEVEKIDEEVKNLHEYLKSPNFGKEVKQLSKNLYVLIMQKIAQHLGSADSLLIALDGQLNLVPFEVLIGEDENLLLKKYTITYLSSGRNLLTIQKHFSSDIKDPLNQVQLDLPAIIGNPDYGSSVNNEVKISDKTRSMLETKILSAENLKGFKKEIEKIKQYITPQIFPMVLEKTGKDATKDSVKSLNNPYFLHMPVHGFFLGDVDKEKDFMMRSGVLLSGVDLGLGKTVSVLFASEMVGLHLFGTKLVVLSACETSLGTTVVGDGVYGMRRALTLAGSESQILSLWAVRDVATADLMDLFYKNLFEKGLGRAEALKKAKENFIMSNPSKSNAYFWAPFVISGDWTKLVVPEK